MKGWKKAPKQPPKTAQSPLLSSKGDLFGKSFNRSIESKDKTNLPHFRYLTLDNLPGEHTKKSHERTENNFVYLLLILLFGNRRKTDDSHTESGLFFCLTSVLG